MDTLYFLICKYVKVNRLAVVVAAFSIGIVISRNLEAYMPLNFQISSGRVVILLRWRKIAK